MRDIRKSQQPLKRDDLSWNRHCEERSDAAIQIDGGTGKAGLAKRDWPSGTGQAGLDCRALLAMTMWVQCDVLAF
jgi:hypothetical protein